MKPVPLGAHVFVTGSVDGQFVCSHQNGLFLPVVDEDGTRLLLHDPDPTMVSSVILVDRETDLVSPMLTQVVVVPESLREW